MANIVIKYEKITPFGGKIGSKAPELVKFRASHIGIPFSV